MQEYKGVVTSADKILTGSKFDVKKLPADVQEKLGEATGAMAFSVQIPSTEQEFKSRYGKTTLELAIIKEQTDTDNRQRALMLKSARGVTTKGSVDVRASIKGLATL